MLKCDTSAALSPFPTLIKEASLYRNYYKTRCVCVIIIIIIFGSEKSVSVVGEIGQYFKFIKSHKSIIYDKGKAIL